MNVFVEKWTTKIITLNSFELEWIVRFTYLRWTRFIWFTYLSCFLLIPERDHANMVIRVNIITPSKTSKV